jgi:MoaD family protein
LRGSGIGDVDAWLKSWSDNLMLVTVKSFAGFKELLGSRLEVSIGEQANILELLQALCIKRPGARDAIFTDEGSIKDYVILMVNKKRVQSWEVASHLLQEGDEVAILPPVAGG